MDSQALSLAPLPSVAVMFGVDSPSRAGSKTAASRAASRAGSKTRDRQVSESRSATAASGASVGALSVASFGASRAASRSANRVASRSASRAASRSASPDRRAFCGRGAAPGPFDAGLAQLSGWPWENGRSRSPEALAQAPLTYTPHYGRLGGMRVASASWKGSPGTCPTELPPGHLRAHLEGRPLRAASPAHLGAGIASVLGGGAGAAPRPIPLSGGSSAIGEWLSSPGPAPDPKDPSPGTQAAGLLTQHKDRRQRPNRPLRKMAGVSPDLVGLLPGSASASTSPSPLADAAGYATAARHDGYGWFKRGGERKTNASVGVWQSMERNPPFAASDAADAEAAARARGPLSDRALPSARDDLFVREHFGERRRSRDLRRSASEDLPRPSESHWLHHEGQSHRDADGSGRRAFSEEPERLLMIRPTEGPNGWR